MDNAIFIALSVRLSLNGWCSGESLTSAVKDHMKETIIRKLAQRFPSGRQEFIYYTNDSYTPFPVPIFRSMTKKNGAFYGYFGVTGFQRHPPIFN